jgi:hypothetical protein
MVFRLANNEWEDDTSSANNELIAMNESRTYLHSNQARRFYQQSIHSFFVPCVQYTITRCGCSYDTLGRLRC